MIRCFKTLDYDSRKKHFITSLKMVSYIIFPTFELCGTSISLRVSVSPRLSLSEFNWHFITVQGKITDFCDKM